MTSERLRTVFVTAVLLFARGAAAADEVRRSTLEELSSLDLAAGAVTVAGLYAELRDQEVQLLGSTARFLLPDTILQRRLLQITASTRNLLLTVSGSEETGGKRVWRIAALDPGPDASEALAEDLRILKSRGPSAIPHLFEFAKRVLKTSSELGRPELLAKAHAAMLGAYELYERDLPKTALEERLAFIRRIHEILGDRDFAINLLADLDRRFPETPAIRRFLVELNARKFRGRWMTYEEFKKRLGFVLYEGEWVKPWVADFRRTIADLKSGKHLDIVLRNRLEEEYRLLADRGEIAQGMTREEVQRALGFPERVYRRRLGTREIDQWLYEDLWCYFIQGYLFKTTRVGPQGRR